MKMESKIENVSTLPLSKTAELVDEDSIVCNSCLGKLVEKSTYRCTTCNPVPDGNRIENQNLAFCKLCIVVLHLKQKHEIVDFKGYVPAVCEKHVDVCSIYCESCSAILCPECIENHCHHTFMPMSEKANQHRGMVFQYLNDSEKRTKELKHKESMARNCFNFISNIKTSLDDENLTKTLLEMYQKVIETNTELWIESNAVVKEDVTEEAAELTEESFQQLEKIVAIGDARCIELKQLLQMSDGTCISNFTKYEESFLESVQKQEGQLEQHHRLKQKRSLHSLVKDSVKNVFERFKLPVVETFVISQMDLTKKNLEYTETFLKAPDKEFEKLPTEKQPCCCDYAVFSFRCDGGTQKFHVVNVTDAPWIVETVVVDGWKVKEVSQKLGFLALCNEENTVFVYSLQERSFVYKYSLDISSFHLNLIIWSNGYYSSCVWNSANNQIDSQPRPSFTKSLDCPIRPKMTEHFSNMFSVVLQTNDVILFSHPNEFQVHLSQIEHGLSCIDNVKLESQNKIFLFDYKFRMVVSFKLNFQSGESEECLVEEVLKVSLPCDEPIEFMSVMEDNLIAYVNGEAYAAKLN